MSIALSICSLKRRTESDGLIGIEVSPLGFITLRTLPLYPGAKTPGIRFLRLRHRSVCAALDEKEI